MSDIGFGTITREDRMRQDKEMIMNPARWPRTNLHVKTQPWIERQEFGFIRPENLRLVINKDPHGMNEGFDSYEALVERWSVD